MIISYSRGNKIIYKNNKWYYDDGSIFNNSKPCKRCNKMPLENGEDACLGHIKGIENACCGHGIDKGYKF
jgi:hypothetical protein